MAAVYPFKKYNYDVQIDGKSVGGFSEVSAPDITIEPIEYREGNFSVNTAGKQPGLVKYSNITLKWGMTTSMDLYNWTKEVENGKVARKTVVISLLDDEHKEIAKWTIIEAWPTKYQGPDFNATSNEVAIESLELVNEGITRDK